MYDMVQMDMHCAHFIVATRRQCCSSLHTSITKKVGLARSTSCPLYIQLRQHFEQVMSQTNGVSDNKKSHNDTPFFTLFVVELSFFTH